MKGSIILFKLLSMQEINMKKKQWRISILLVSILIIFIILHENIAYAEETDNKNLNVLFISSYNSNFISFEDQVE